MGNNPNVLFPDDPEIIRPKCPFCHRTRHFLPAENVYQCPECGDKLTLTVEDRPASRLAEANSVNSYLVQPGAKIQETDVPNGYVLVKEDELSPPQTRRRTYSPGDWDTFVMS